jgi:hypothetical protein
VLLLADLLAYRIQAIGLDILISYIPGCFAISTETVFACVLVIFAPINVRLDLLLLRGFIAIIIIIRLWRWALSLATSLHPFLQLRNSGEFHFTPLIICLGAD